MNGSTPALNETNLNKLQDNVEDAINNDVFDLIYPVGSIYMSVSNVNPNLLFSGTWEQITSDAYLKIVTSNAGILDGTSNEHKIPVESMPSHTHKLTAGINNEGSSSYTNAKYLGYSSTETLTYGIAEATGGGEAYYPYYLGVYVWKRVS